MKNELEWLRELEQDAQVAWKECPFENWLLVRSKISNRIIELLEVRTAVPAPDSSTPFQLDGGASGRCPKRLNGNLPQCSWGAGHAGRCTFEPDLDIYRTFHCSCGAAVTAMEYAEHVRLGHDKEAPLPTTNKEVQHG